MAGDVQDSVYRSERASVPDLGYLPRGRGVLDCSAGLAREVINGIL